MKRTAAILVVLLALALVARAAAAEAHALRNLKTPCTSAQAAVTIPDNMLTGRGAIATPDGVAHF